MQIELKPCPFCGKIPYFRQVSTAFSQSIKSTEFKIRCDKCGYDWGKLYLFEVQFVLESDSGVRIIKDGRSECAEAWNRRADNG